MPLHRETRKIGGRRGSCLIEKEKSRAPVSEILSLDDR